MMQRLSILRVLALLATAVLAVSATATTVLDDSFAVQRPLSDFIEAQGNFLGWTSAQQNRAAAVDYTGLANKAIVEVGGASLGTLTEGTILERPLADGRAEITVTLHTRQALTWVIAGDGQGNFDFSAGRLLFGHRVPEVLDGARPVLGDSLLEVVFTNPTPGSPLPDLEQILFAPVPGQELRFISFFASAGGPPREALDVPDGATEQMEVRQSGLLMTSLSGAASAGLPAERIDLDSVAAAQPACSGNRPCNDGNHCTFGDRCKAGVCVGTAYSCNDGNVCTTDACDGAGGCSFSNNTVPCNDGNACTQGDTCSGGACVSGSPTVCHDFSVCTTDSCNPASGCVFTNSTDPCDDNNVCTVNDTCSDGICAGGTPTSGACDDGNACTVNDTCSNGACQGTVDPNCGCISCEFDLCPSGMVCAGICCEFF